ncbi:MAG TPA: ABC transporter permease [Acetobacteraceae bacterium]|nr:ABC transporter permease [Acetobacteraceae bacterium]
MTAHAQVAARRGFRLDLSGVSGLLLLLPTLLLLVLIFLYPLAVVLSRSFTEPHLGLQNYVALYWSQAFRNILVNTFEIAGWTTAICLLLGYPFSYQLARLPKRWAQPLLGLCMIPFFTAILARLYAWTIILGDAGVINTYLLQWGIIHHPISLLFNRTAVIIGMVHVMLPYMVIVLYSQMVGIDRSLLDAATSLGASPLAGFRRVFLPLSMPGTYAGTLLVFIISLGFFVTPAVLGGGRDVTIATFVRQEIGVLDWGAATAMSMVLLLVTVGLFFLLDRVFGTERLLVGGLRN